MKLRSGKILSFELPKKLENELETNLQRFKKVFAGNAQHEKEFLRIISQAKNIEARFDIRDKIEELYDDNTRPGGTADISGAVGALAWTLVFNPQYHRQSNRTYLQHYQ